MASDKVARGNASQFFVAGELCRRGFYAVVTLGNTPNTDVLCSNRDGTRFAHIQVKTFVPGNRTCSVGAKAERSYGPNFFWVLGGIPPAGSSDPCVYYVIPSSVMAKHISQEYSTWLAAPSKSGAPHKDSGMRVVWLPPAKSRAGWDIAEYRNKWDLIANVLQS